MVPAENSVAAVPPEPRPVRAWRRWVRSVSLGLLATAGLAVILLGPEPSVLWEVVRDNLVSWQSWVSRNALLALLAYFLFFTLATALPLPILTVMSLLAGALFGITLGTAIASLAYTAGVTTAFLVVRWFLRDRVRRSLGGWLRRIERGVERDGAYYLLTLRLMPSVPFSLVNVLMALTPLPTRVYVLVSWLGVLPYTLICSNVGTQLASLRSPADVLSVSAVASLVALALLPLVARKLLRIARPPALNVEPT